jgi:hypothetical protein
MAGIAAVKVAKSCYFGNKTKKHTQKEALCANYADKSFNNKITTAWF